MMRDWISRFSAVAGFLMDVDGVTFGDAFMEADSAGSQTLRDGCNPLLAFARSLKVAAPGAALAGWAGMGRVGWGECRGIEGGKR